MSATQSSDFVFEPKVWKDHIRAYFNKKLIFGALADMDNTLANAPGETINFPYFKAIGDVEEPQEDEGLVVDKLQDDSFSATVKEVGKAVGIKKKAFKKSATTKERIIAEIQEQLGRVHAEKMDADLVAELNQVGSYVQGYTATLAGDTMNIRTMLEGKIVGFGDKHTDAIAIQMHSLQFMDLMKDSTAGFLKADAMDPFNGMNGFEGRLLGMAIFVSDQTPAGSTIGGKNSYHAFIHKMTPYGIIMKQDMELESDYDILAREWVFTSNEWYAVKSFHAKVSALDYKSCRLTTTVSV
jgi:hypothetical protein